MLRSFWTSFYTYNLDVYFIPLHSAFPHLHFAASQPFSHSSIVPKTVVAIVPRRQSIHYHSNPSLFSVALIWILHPQLLQWSHKNGFLSQKSSYSSIIHRSISYQTLSSTFSTPSPNHRSSNIFNQPLPIDHSTLPRYQQTRHDRRRNNHFSQSSDHLFQNLHKMFWPILSSVISILIDLSSYPSINVHSPISTMHSYRPNRLPLFFF